MTPQTEIILRIALGSASIFLFIAGLYLLLKTTNGPFGFRPRDQFNAALDDVRERLAIVENNLEALDPEGPGGALSTLQKIQVVRDITILMEFEAEIGNSHLFKRILAALDAQDVAQGNPVLDRNKPQRSTHWTND